MAAVRSLRWMLWAIGVLAIVTALIDIALQLHIPVAAAVIAPSADLVTALVADRAYDTQVYPDHRDRHRLRDRNCPRFSRSWGAGFVPSPPMAGWSDEIKMAFVVAGALGIVSQVINFAVAHEAASGYCDWRLQDAGPDLAGSHARHGVDHPGAGLLVAAEVLAGPV